MNFIFLCFAIFIASLLVIELSFYALRIIQHPDRETVRNRLRQNTTVENMSKDVDLYKKQLLSDVPFINRFLTSIPWLKRLKRTLNQANLNCTLGFILLLSMVMGLVGYLVFIYLTGNLWLSILIAMISACLPLLYVRWKKNERMAKFEKQLPDALDLIARSLRAGHAFNMGIKLASQEIEDPLGPEFSETLDEINFGLNVAEALKNLARRVNCIDLKYFVVAVILQRETGGNLAEIIETLAHLIRERLKFRGKVRVLSAEGRLSATILMLLPFFLFFFLYLGNPEYMKPLYLDPIGKVLLAISGIMMFIGLMVIKRIIKVEI